ncbi:MAG: thioredoxin family protein [Pseudomonadota bacterium]
MHLVELTEFDFHPCLAHSAGVSLVMFSGPDCGSCRRLEKVLPALTAGRVAHLYKVDVQVSTALAREYEVFHLPSLFLFVDGRFHAPLHAESAPGIFAAAIEHALREPAHEEP